jgi:hypothetical protein
VPISVDRVSVFPTLSANVFENRATARLLCGKWIFGDPTLLFSERHSMANGQFQAELRQLRTMLAGPMTDADLVTLRGSKASWVGVEDASCALTWAAIFSASEISVATFLRTALPFSR